MILCIGRGNEEAGRVRELRPTGIEIPRLHAARQVNFSEQKLGMQSLPVLCIVFCPL